MTAFSRRRGLDRGVTVPPTVVVSDTFTRADASTLGNAETGQAWVIVTAGATFGIVSNQARQSNATNPGTAVVDSGVSDCTVQADLLVSSGLGLVWRDSDGDNQFVHTISGGTTYRKQAGSFTSIANLGAGAAGPGTYKVVCSGTQSKIYKDGVLVGTITSSFNQTATRHGFYVPGVTSPRVDNFLVTTP